MTDFVEERGGGFEAVAGFVGEAGGGRFFEDFLVAALRGAVAFAESEDVALAVAEDLDFDVAGAGYVFFEVDAGVAEVGAAEAQDGLVGFGELLGRVADAHADAAAAAGALEHDRVGEGVGLGEGVVEVGEQAGAGEERNAAGLGGGAGGVLEREGFDVLGRGADEGDAAGGAGAGEVDIFAEEAVAGMDGFGAGFGGGGEDGVEGEIALRGGRFADEDGFVGVEDVERVLVGDRSRRRRSRRPCA